MTQEQADAEFAAIVAKVQRDHGGRWQIGHDDRTWPRTWTATDRTAPQRVVVADGIIGLADKLRKASAAHAH